MDPITLQDILNELAREGGDVAAFLAAAVTEGRLTVETADELLAEAAASGQALVNAETRTSADVATLTVLADAVDAVRATRADLVTAAAAEAEQIAALASRIAPPADDETNTEDPAAEDVATEGDPDNSDSGLTVPEDLDVANAPVEDLTSTAGDPALVASTEPPARRPRVDLSQIARRTQRPAMPVLGNGSDLPFGGSLVASADAPGMRAGSAYNSWLDLGHAGAKAFGSMNPGQLRSMVASAEQSGGPEFRQRTGLAEFRMNFPPELIANGQDDTEVFAYAADQSRLEGGSLTAAGWCSPSETMYDLCELPCSLDGILSTPEVGAPRGGVRWTKGLDFEAIYNGTGYFHFTETQMSADPRPDKPCMEIPCVDFSECRLDVDGLCITGDIMQSRTYPEVVAQFMQGAMCAHAHRVNAFKLAAISAGSTNDGTITMAGLGATNNVLYAIELEIQAYRYRGRRAQEGNPALLELVAPYWIKGIIRADLANRNGVDLMAVTDAQIVAWFATRGVAVQFVYDWQDLVGVVASPGAPVVDYPNTVEFLLYEAGTWIVPMLDVITLESIYDSTLIRQNKFTALFTEQAFCVINRCNGSRRFTVPICANGNTGLQVQAVCA